MNLHNSIASLLALVVAFGAASSLQAAGPAKPKVLIDFTVQEVSRDGADVRPINKYDYAWDTWTNKIVFLDKRGLLIPFLPGKGCFGGDKQMKLTDYSAVELTAVIGNQNVSTGCAITLIDSDGTEATWDLPLAGKPRGADLVYRLELAKSDRQDKPGKVPGLDKIKIRKWQIKGNWQEPKVEVLFVKLTAVP